MDICERKGHVFSERYDEEIVKMHNDYHETHVSKSYICDICTRCGKVIERKK